MPYSMIVVPLELRPVRLMLFLTGLGALGSAGQSNLRSVLVVAVCAGLLWWHPMVRLGMLLVDAIEWLRWRFAR